LIVKAPSVNSGGVFVFVGFMLAGSCWVIHRLFIRMKKKKPVPSRFAKAGSVKSRAKTAAARKNGLLGGRPPKWK
jgi:hypothetical protein